MRGNKLLDTQNEADLNYKLSFVVDKFLIVYIYASTTAIFPLYIGLGIRYFSYALFLLAILATFISSSRYYLSLIKPVVFVSIYIIINLLVFFLYRTDVLSFIFNIKYLFFILFIFLIPALGKSYSLNRYIKHFFLGILVQALTTVFLVLLYKTIGYQRLSVFSNYLDLSVMQSSGFNDQSVRVVSRLNPLLIPCFFYFIAVHKKNWFSILALVTVTLALYYTKSLGLYLALLVGFGIFVITYFRLKKNFILLYILTMFVSLNVLIIYMTHFFGSYAGKSFSALVKSEQVLSIGKLSLFNLLFGYGHGYVFYDKVRGLFDVVIEVLPVYWIFVSGILGLIVLLYLFLYPLSGYNKYIFINPEGRKFYRFLIASQVAVFFTGLSNAYLLSGSTAFFLVFFYCYFVYEMENDIKKSEEYTCLIK